MRVDRDSSPGSPLLDLPGDGGEKESITEASSATVKPDLVSVENAGGGHGPHYELTAGGEQA